MSRDFVGALLQLNAEKGVSREQLVRTVEEAIQSAYRRVAGDEDIQVRIDAESGKVRVFRARLVVEEIDDPTTQMTLADAQAHQPGAEIGDLVETEQLDQEAFGRIHAQTAKQVVLQRLHEAERNVVFDQYASREGELITGTVSRVEPRAIVLDVGKAEAILATTEQSPLEHYRIGQNVKAYVLEVRRSAKGPQIYVSRTHKGFLRRLFELEVPEVHAGTVEIKAIAREAGSRSKVAVASRQPGLDPVGATVGQRGARVQAVVAELGGEKIDVIEWSEDASTFVAKALSPAQVIEVRIDEEHRIANVVVPERMLSLAIGREGQNARLAAKLTGWRIDIRSDVSVAEAAKAEAEAEGRSLETAGAADTAEATATQAGAPESTLAPESESVAAQPAETTPEAPAKPKRRKAVPSVPEPAAEAEPTASPAAEPTPEAPAKPKRRKAVPSVPEPATEAEPTAAATAETTPEAPAKPKRRKAAPAEPAADGEVSP
ncbi:MAG TPA: transcription termination factor NusA [Candidatus Limnocylindrales bacterium]|jgi:transcription termination factor NusA|nr:transcription termination factor NusA [Candidatus Limnocylindrales bacterium]